MENQKKEKVNYLKIGIGAGIGFFLAKLLFEHVWPLIF